MLSDPLALEPLRFALRLALAKLLLLIELSITLPHVFSARLGVLEWHVENKETTAKLVNRGKD